MNDKDMQPRWWEEPVRFMDSYWWVILLVVAVAITAYFTRCYWNPGFCSTRISIQNSSPQDLQVILLGDQRVTINIPKCKSCEVYPDPGPTDCPKKGTTVQQRIEPGTYLISVSPVDNPLDPIPFNGQITILPDQLTSECFFITEKGFGGVGLKEELPEPTPTEAQATKEISSTPTLQPTSEVGWLDFTSEQIGLKLKYPDTWYGEEGNDLVSFNSEFNNHVEISRSPLPEGMDLSTYVDSLYSSSDFSKILSNEETLNLVDWVVTTHLYNDVDWEIVTYATLVNDNVIAIRFFNSSTSSSFEQTTDEANFLAMINSVQLLLEE